MDKTLLSLVKEGKTNEIKDLLDEETDIQNLTDCITRVILKGSQDPVPVIHCVLSASQDDKEKSKERCSSVYISLMKLLQKNEVNSKTSFRVVSALLSELKSMQPDCLRDLAQYFVTSVKNGSYSGGKVAELMPAALSLLNACPKVPQGEGYLTGTEFKGHFINSLCSCRWAPNVALNLVSLFNDIPLISEELRFVIEKILRLFGSFELADQPAVVFQLLRLSAKGHQRLVLEGITKHFVSQDDQNRQRSIMMDSEDLLADTTCLTTLYQIEGTIILHIMQAVKQNQDLGSQLVKYMKAMQQSNAQNAVFPFNLSLMLCISQLHQFEDQIFELLKGAIVKCFRDEERQQQSLWVRECYAVGLKTEDLVLDAVEHSTYDWDHVTPGLVKLGFSLMETFGPKLVFGAMPENIAVKEHLTPTQRACQLGRRMLLKTFKSHEVVRSEILDRIFSNIIMKSSAPVTHYLDLLGDTVHSAPQLLLESTSKIQDLFLKLPHLPAQTAKGLMSALQSLLKLRPLLKDTLILVLRKAMFSRQLQARKNGAMGFLIMLKNFRVLGGLPSSQVSQPISMSQMVDVHQTHNASTNEALCLEILGNLRRCFTQQADIRLNLYQGFCEVLHRNSQLKDPVLVMLLSQLKLYYESNEDVSPPLRLEPCILSQGENVYLAEPLGHLLGCVQQCVRKAVFIDSCTQTEEDEDDDEASDSSGEKKPLKQLTDILTALTKRLIDADMEDFELDKSADFSLGNSVGVKNNIYAILLLGIYEVLIEYNFESGNFSSQSCENVLKLFTNHSKLGAAVKERTAAAAGKKGKATTTKTPNSLLSLNCVTNMLKAIIDDQSTEHEEGVNHLRENKDFFSFLVSVALHKLGQIETKGTCEGETDNKEKIFKICYLLGRLFYLYYVENQVSGDTARHQDKKLASDCLEGLRLIISAVSSIDFTSLVQCLMYLEKEPVDGKDQIPEIANRSEKILLSVKKFQRLMAAILNETADNQNWKEFSSLLSVVEYLSNHMSPQSTEYQHVYTTVLELATDQNIDDATTCKQLLSFLLKLAKQTKHLPQLLRNLCQDIHSQLGDIDQDCEVEDKTHYTVSKSNNCPTTALLTITLAHQEEELDNIDWVIKRHKAEMLAGGSGEEELASTQVEAKDKAVCTRVGMLVNGFTELTHSAIINKLCSQALLKALTKLYNTLTALTKHYISLYDNKAGHLGNRFEKLINLVGKQLTQSTYNMIIFVQSEDTEAGTEKKEKGKKKAESAAQSGVARTMKQMKIIPNLIFAIEQLEKFLIQLTKKSKIDLMQNLKHSTSRDFRINHVKVTEAVEQAVSDEEENDTEADSETEAGANDSDSDSEQENQAPDESQSDEPPAKKKK